MADDNKVSFLLDLDISEFTEKGLNAKGIIEKIGDSENLTGLLESITSVGPLLAAAGVAAFAFKEAIDLTVEGEEIERVNAQFETLAKNAGIAPDKLKEGLEESAKGLIDTDDLLKIANESIVKMGGSADKLPQILDIATKSVQIYGGTAKSNFQAISEAMANGNVRMLKSYGIRVDATKAEKDFAAANGKTADTLSDAGKKQAIFNAAVDAGSKAFKDVEVNTNSATTILQTLKVTFSEIGEAFIIVFEKTIGPAVRAFLHSIQNIATQTKLHLQSIGDSAEASAAKLTLTKQRISDIEAELTKLQKIKGTALDFSPGDTQAKLAALPKQLEKLKSQLAVLDEKSTADQIQNINKVSQASIADQEKEKKQYADFKKQLDTIDSKSLDLEKKNISSLSQVETLLKQTKLAAETKFQTSIEAIRNKTNLTDKQKDALIVAEKQQHNQEILQNEQTLEAERLKLLDSYVKNSKTAFQGIGRAFEANSLKMKAEMNDFGKMGTQVWNSFSSNATSAFTTMGSEMAQGKDIASATVDAMKGLFLGMLGDRAIASGSVMLAESVWPPNPLGLAGGAALLALGGALKSAAGSGAAASTAISAPSPQATSAGATAPQVPVSSSGSDSSTADSSSTATANMDQQVTAQRTVSVNIAGNYLETDSTKRMLMDLMRQESDATGFNYNQIGA